MRNNGLEREEEEKKKRRENKKKFTYGKIIYKRLNMLQQFNVIFPKKGDMLKKSWTIITYLPTPPLGQDMTQGQFLSGV